MSVERYGGGLSALLILVAGCGEQAGAPAANGIVVTGPSAEAPAAPAPEETRGQEFLGAVLGSFDFALASGRQASERADPASTKTFARRLTATVTAARDDLAGIARAGNLRLEPVAGPTHQLDLAVLSSTRGTPLSQAFAEQQMASLTLLVGTMRAYKNGGDNPQLRAWADKHQGPINERLLDVQTLNAELETAAESGAR